MTSPRALVVVLGALLSPGCYESHGTGPVERPLPASTLEVDLTGAQYAELCEWFATRAGGELGWPDNSHYFCGDGGSVGRVLTPENCALRRHDPALIGACPFRVADWYACADHYADAGLCGDSPETCRRPDECMDGTGRWRYLHP